MGSVSWRRGNRLIITAAQVYAQRRVADGRKWVFVLRISAPVKSSAARAAHREQSSLLRLFRASNACANARDALFVRHDIEPCAKAFARKSHRTDWPETNVGASFARDAPRGRRSISRAPTTSRRTPDSRYQRNIWIPINRPTGSAKIKPFIAIIPASPATNCPHASPARQLFRP